MPALDDVRLSSRLAKMTIDEPSRKRKAASGEQTDKGQAAKKRYNTGSEHYPALSEFRHRRGSRRISEPTSIWP